jgi:hypothetical protein
MLNFRYHVVSLVAVFLALGIGILVGYGALDRPTVDFLQNRIGTVEANAEQRRQENEQLQSELDRQDEASSATSPFAVTDRLTEVPVAVVAVRGVDGETVTRAVTLARRGGGVAPGILWLEEPWALEEDEQVDALATALGLAAADTKAELRRDALVDLEGRLVGGPPAAGDDSLGALADAGFVTFEAVGEDGGSLAELGGPGTRVLLIVGTDDVLRTRQVLVPIARAAVLDQLALVVGEVFVDGEDAPARGALVSNIRSDEALASRISTVDSLDQPTGDAVALLALADLERNVVGHYGFGEGATAPAPEWWQP